MQNMFGSECSGKQHGLVYPGGQRGMGQGAICTTQVQKVTTVDTNMNVDILSPSYCI